MTDLKQRILTAVGPDLAAIEQALADHLDPHYELVRQVAGHLLFAGGKRLRPLLMLLCGRLCGHDTQDAIPSAIIFEYLHAATLIHDDVVDGADLRRGRTVAHKVWDAPTAVLTGDFLLARALTLAARTQMPAVIATIAGITEFMAQGEINQLARKGDVTLSEADYMDVIRCKTAVLFQGACRVGGLLARAPEPTIAALADYGLHLGMAFQMADDLLDYTQQTDTLGKRAGADLLEGKLTLPVIHALRHATPAEQAWMKTLIAEQAFTPDQLQQFIAILQSCGAIAYTRDRAADHMARAKTILDGFPPGPARTVLADIVDYAWARAN